jgi:aminobenzoyl-glutamate utilization protein B
MSKFTNEIIKHLDQNFEQLSDISLKIWNYAELPLEEKQSSAILQKYLISNGFSLTTGLAGMNTAFSASWGTGFPVIGLLGEFDALPEMSQHVCSDRKPVVEGTPGHACGHNLLGTGMAGAAVTIKELLEKYNLPGTIRFYGCPAEETMYGKIKMDEEHLFDDTDVCLSWHPMNSNTVSEYSYSAMISLKFNFKGKAAHAAQSPEHGRSALDAVELMNVGANYLREHMIREARIHYVITNGGGRPNVVPCAAQNWYFVRAPYKNQLDELVQRLIDISRGAALMTGTQVSHEVVSGCYNTVLNDNLNKILYDSMNRIPCPIWSKEELEYARKLQKTIDIDARRNTLGSYAITELEGQILHTGVTPLNSKPILLAGSTDISNVSKTVPTAQVFTCCMPLGTPGHTWQVTASVGSSIGHKGMIYAAKVIADAAMVLFTEPDVVEKAKHEFIDKKKLASV